MCRVASCFCSLFFLTCAVFSTESHVAAALAATPAQVSPSAHDEVRRITGVRVNIRAGAGLRFKVTDQLVKGDTVHILATSRADGDTWHNIRLRSGGTGWVSGQFLSTPKTPATAPTTPEVSAATTFPTTRDMPKTSGATAPASPVRMSSTAPALPATDTVSLEPGASVRLKGAISSASDLDFTVFNKGQGGPGVLVFGGIQGDEPGGFSAASLLVTHYDITKGTVVIAPNLNFPSIVDRSRGSCGDMNRKFAGLTPHDPQYAQVNRVQELIRRPDVGLILNLHDGSGFYRTEHQSALRNPRRWGQSVIIDKAHGPDGSDLTAMATATATGVNAALLKPEHRIGVRNTRTDEGNVEMAKTLTWFAVRNGKTAFGLEASKELGVAERVYYHLRMVEGFLAQTGVEFTRRFALTPEGITAALAANARYTLLEPRTLLPLHNVRPRLAGVLPLTRPAKHESGSPLLAVITPGGDKSRIQVHYGNNLLTQSAVRWFEADTSLDEVTVTVDGEKRPVRFGEVLSVRSAFTVERIPGYRVNAIGATAHASDESGLSLSKRDFQTAYSLDRSGRLYRVETYRGERLVGMFVVAFGAPTMAEAGLPGLTAQNLEPSPAASGPVTASPTPPDKSYVGR